MKPATVEFLRKRVQQEFARTEPPQGFPDLPTIPPGRYPDSAFFELEKEHIFGKAWLYVGTRWDFPEVGSFKVVRQGAYPTDLLEWMVREEGLISAEKAHYGLSRLPASRASSVPAQRLASCSGTVGGRRLHMAKSSLRDRVPIAGARAKSPRRRPRHVNSHDIAQLIGVRAPSLYYQFPRQGRHLRGACRLRGGRSAGARGAPGLGRRTRGRAPLPVDVGSRLPTLLAPLR